MKVIRASDMGMCFGVKKALEITKEVVDATDTTVHGELVHNELVNNDLLSRGFKMNSEITRDNVPDTNKVLITAHGVSDKERSRLKNAGKELIDTTCPLVHVVHAAARKFHREGFFVIVIGKKNHVEVLGITGDLTRFEVVERVEDVREYEHSQIGVVCQSTTPPALADKILDEIHRKNPNWMVKCVNTICHPTRDRQIAMQKLIDQVDVVVAVGGVNSNNTFQLARLARSKGVPAFHVQDANDLHPEDFKKYSVVGLTAGTSTLDSTVDAVHKRLAKFNCLIPAGKVHVKKRNRYVDTYGDIAASG